MKITSRFARAAALTMLAVTGAAAGAGIWATAANAWDIDNLPNGYSTTRIHLDGGCIDLQISYGTAGTTDIGSTCDPGFQAALDSYVNGSICTVNPAAGQAQGMCLPPTTTVETTVATTTAPTTTAEPVLTVAAPPTTTSALPTDTTATTTTVATEPTVEQRLAALEAQYAALSARVDAIKQANTASWDAFIGVINSGGTVADAALAARSAGLNAVYQLA